MALMKFRESNQVKWVGVRPGHNGTQVTKWGSADNETVILYTVTAGKILYLVHYTVFISSDVADRWGFMGVRNDADVEQYRFSTGVFKQVGSIGFGVGLKYPIEIPAGWDIFLVSNSADSHINGFIHGWEE